jgi:GT2 family glycosyltransferase
MRTASKASGPQVSVVICTRDRVPALRHALASIAHAAAAADLRIELIVVDNGTAADGTSDLVRDFAARAEFDVCLLQEARPGLARARNLGLRAAAADILVLTDDDCRMAPDYFVQLAALYATATGPAMIGGRVDLGDPADLPITIKTDDRPANFEGLGAGGFILGCNMTLNRAAVAALGPFDERLGAGSPLKSAEDTDYIYRAWRAGIPIAYEPRLRVAHFHGRRSAAEGRRLMHGYAVGNGALYAKHIRTPLIRQLYWDLRAACHEPLGAPRSAPPFGLPYRRVVAANLTGMALFCGLWLRAWVDRGRNDATRACTRPSARAAPRSVE